ncbi:MAG: family 43 glycosylhydrolase [Prevotella sp.]|nr:family 43 glycosylhydrolase [Prevotella sp.]
MNNLTTLILLLISLPSLAQWGNPIITDAYSADPSAHVFGDTLWLYPSHDRDDAASFSMEDYHVYSTTDMKTWRDHGVIFNPLRQTTWAKGEAWAPDCIYRNGKYYLYYPTDKRHIGVAVGDTPYGPFRDPLGHPLISIDSPGVVCDRDFIDPAVFIDDDGQAYLFMGQNTVCCIKLNDDMVTYDGKVHIIEGVRDFFEAVWVHKRDGIYYMSYSDGPFRGHEPQIAYCTATSPLGPYRYQGVILDPVNSGTNHHSIVTYKGQDYLFYHTADLSRTLAPGYHCGVRRSVCVDSLFYNADGTIRKVQPTLNREKLLLGGVSDRRKSALIAGSVRKPSIPKGTFTLTSERGDRQHLQGLIDSVSAQGGGTVTVMAGEYLMDGPLEMKSGVRLHLKDGALLRFTSEPDAYLPVVLTRWEGTELYGRSSMIHAYGQHDIAVTGEGTATIDCGGGTMARWGMPMGVENFEENIHGTHGETPEMPDVNRLRQMGDDLTPVAERVFGKGTKLRPCGIEFNACEKVKIEGITLKNSPFWCIHPLYCEDVTVRNVTIDSHFPNNDGCDPESSRRVLIENCTFRTGDDAVAIKAGRDADGRRVARPSEDIVIRHCRFYSKCNGLCIGSEMSGGVRGVYMTDIEVGDVKNALLFKSNLDRGGYIENVYVDSISIGNVAGAVLRFETNYFGYRGGNFPARYSDFRISNVCARSSAAYAIYFDGNAAEPISDITVSNFTVTTAPHPHYLFHTRRCTFNGCTVGGRNLPSVLPESKERQQCDVW